MKVRITDELAQQIVDSARAVVGWNINFIDRHGRIMASTDSGRIGTYHKAGHVAARTGQVQTVQEDRLEDGVSRGVNYPIIMDHQVLGVIGITGNPAVVGQYGFLLTKICEVFLKEYRLSQEAFSEEAHRSRQVMALIYRDEDTVQQLAEDQPELAGSCYTAVVFRWHDGFRQAGAFRQKMAGFCQKLGVSLYTYVYPNMFIRILSLSSFPAGAMQNGTENCLSGKNGSIRKSWPVSGRKKLSTVSTNRTVLPKWFAGSRGPAGLCVHADDMKLAFLLQSLDGAVRRRYCQDICHLLTDSDIHLLQVYYQQDLSIQETARILCIHKNTQQYRLKRIAGKTGLDPRVFCDAVPLYIATLPWFRK